MYSNVVNVFELWDDEWSIDQSDCNISYKWWTKINTVKY